MSEKTLRLTMAQALVRYLCNQVTEIDGPGLTPELEIAVPGAREERARRRQFGLSLF